MHFRFMDLFSVKDAPKAGELRNLCSETIQKLSAQYSSSIEDDSTEDYLMNRHQCDFLVGRLTETGDTLEKIQLSPLLDDRTIPVLKELHQVLLDVETVLNASRITSSQWPRAAIEQSDMRETFARLLDGVQWHASVLLSFYVDNLQESSITFEPAFCEGRLSMGDEFSLLTAMKKDEESLKNRLRSVKLDDPTEKWFANELLKQKMRSEEDDLPNTSSNADDSTRFCLDPQYLGDLSGTLLGEGGYAKVRRMNLMGGKYAIKIFGTKSIDQELKALQQLGRHPHIVRFLCYSEAEEDTRCYLIMEEMDKDLETVLSEILRERTRKKLTRKSPLSYVQAVALMLQIGEGVKYIHSKGMAHRDLKSGNVLVNLDSSSRIRSVKIADFGMTKTKNASKTHSGQSVNKGTNQWMAPEVINLIPGGDKKKFNLRKADVYSFAIVCFEVLTGKVPYSDHVGLSRKLLKEQVKAGTLRPKLPDDCPPKLAALITRCWDPISQKRPLFPEICKELRFIKGLLLRGDQRMSEVQDIGLLGPELGLGLGPLERAQIQGPWGGDGGGNFFDVGTSINRMKLTYQPRGILGSMEMDYNFAGRNLMRRCSGSVYGDRYEEIVFEPDEFITHISGFESKTPIHVLGSHLDPIDVIASLTIHTNFRSYGPFGNEMGKAFASDKGRVIGFHGGSGYVLDSLGVVMIPGDRS